MARSGWTQPIPVYVTRETAEGVVGNITLTPLVILPTLILVWLNIIGWATYGLVELASKVL